ncbi:hypothetical protein D3C85_685130 [compost metagenome]
MIPGELLTALTNDLYAHDVPRPRYLVALIDMATLPQETRQKLTDHPGFDLQPLLLAPGLEQLRPLGPHLACPREATRKGHGALIDSLARYDSNTIVAWITSTVSADVLARHLSQATFVDTQDSERYVLRYYDSRVTPKLLRHAPEQWREWLLAPVVSWWCRGATPSQEQWHRIRGGARSIPIVAAPRLVMDAALWQALESDPLPFRLLETLNETSPALFSSPCHGVRLALIESLLSQGKSLGLIDHHNLTDFIVLTLQHTPQRLQGTAHWHAALQRSARGEGRLGQLFLQGARP